MAIPEHLRRNFDTLLSAAAQNDLALFECLDATTREPRYVLCAIVEVTQGGEGTTYVMTPFGHLAEDPYAAYIPDGDPRT